jgi:dephospho-CoA kinase
MIKNSNNEPKLENSVVIAITGGIGSGKTEVAKYLVQKGYSVISTDELAKEVMSVNDEVVSRLTKAFGKETYTEGNILNTSYLSSKVFTGDADQKSNIEKLNSIVHPYVIEKMIDEIEVKVLNGSKIVFVESALIFESALEDGFDYVVSVIAEDDLRIKRVINRSGLSREQILSRMNEQISQEQKIKLSDFMIENNKSLESLFSAVDFLLPILSILPPKLDYSEND